MFPLLRVPGLFAAAMLLIMSSAAWPGFSGATAAPLNLNEDLETLRRDLKRSIPKAMAEHHVPGLQIALIREGRLVWSAAFGRMQVDESALVTTGAVFEAASLGKPVAAYAALRFTDAGRLEAKRPLAKYVDPASPFLESGPRANRIHLMHVLSHTSGLTNRMGDLKRPITFEPGSKHKYSGVGFQYAQHVMERVARAPFDEIMKATFRELAMGSSAYVYRPPVPARLAPGHLAGRGRRLVIMAVCALWVVVHLLVLTAMHFLRGGTRWWRNLSLLVLIVGTIALLLSSRALPYPVGWDANRTANAASSLYSTAEDLARFASVFMNPDSEQRAAVAAMLTPRVRINDRLAWGAGIGLQTRNGRKSFWQWGSNMAYQSLLLGYPREKIGLIVLTNSSNGLEIIPDIARRAIGGDMDWLEYPGVR